MEIGVCGGPELSGVAKKAGFSYFEWSVGAFLQPRYPEIQFLETLTRVNQEKFPCPVVNVFIPADLKITGPNVNDKALDDYIKTALERAKKAGVKIIVFGSGGARQVPNLFDRKTAWSQLINFSGRLSSLAVDQDVVIALEPLNKQECNILNSVSECAVLVREINHPNFRLLVDAYHWAKDGESPDAIVEAGDLLVHAHIATPVNRLAPGAEEFNFTPFFLALKTAGYTGRISVEARLDPSNLEVELINARELIDRYA